MKNETFEEKKLEEFRKKFYYRTEDTQTHINKHEEVYVVQPVLIEDFISKALQSQKETLLESMPKDAIEYNGGDMKPGVVYATKDFAIGWNTCKDEIKKIIKEN